MSSEVIVSLLLYGVDTIIFYSFLSLYLLPRSPQLQRLKPLVVVVVWLIQVGIGRCFVVQAQYGIFFCFLITVFATLLLFSGRILEGLFLIVLLYSFLFIGEVLTYGIFKLVGIELTYTLAGIYIMMSLISRLISIFLIMGACIINRRGYHKIGTESNFYRLFILIPVPVLICFITLRYSPYVQITVSILFWLCFLSLLLSLGYISLLIRKIIENQRLLEYERVNNEMHRRMEEEYAKFASANHDLRHHIRHIKHINENYAEELYSHITDRKTATGNFIFDQVIQEASTMLSGAEFEITGTLPQVIPNLKESDMVALFGNGLENSINAVRCLEPENRRIEISLNFDGYSLFVTIKNKYLPNDRYKGSGLGIENMKAIVRKYDGKLRITEEQERYTLYIMLQTKLAK
ncbi:MAG: GHKL domain-containing protein [Lachnospiraceae bacterium]